MEHNLQTQAQMSRMLEEPNRALMAVSGVIAAGIGLMLLVLATISY